MNWAPVVAAVVVATGLQACQASPPRSAIAAAAGEAHREARPFDPAQSDAQYRQAHDAALAGLGVEGAPMRALVVFGANWCHDSRALAGWLLDPGHADSLAGKFAIVFIDVATPQQDKGRNLDLLGRYGLADLRSTPAVVVVDKTGRRLNAIDDAKAWRNAASRGDAEIAAAMKGYSALAAD